MKYYYQVEGFIRNNIGDVLQGMVAKDLLPRENTYVVDREALSDIDSNVPALFIANGWYMHNFDRFPAPSNVIPVYISVHVANSKLLGDANVREHFKLNAPIGCRDTKTKQLFLGWGIPAYYSGCLTVTCNKRTEINVSGKGEVLLVDNVDHPIPNDIKDKLENFFNTDLIRISHDPEDVTGTLEEYNATVEKQMNHLLKKYCEAKLVITTKIHCALPSLGMGANVLLIHPNPSDPRLDTLREFMSILSYEDVLKGNIHMPVVNKTKLRARQKFLKEIVKKSVASNSNVVLTSPEFKYKWLRFRSLINSYVYRVIVFTMFYLGIKKEQIQKVYGIGTKA